MTSGRKRRKSGGERPGKGSGLVPKLRPVMSKRDWLIKLVNVMRAIEGMPPRNESVKSGWMRMFAKWGPVYFWTATHEQQRTVRQWIRIIGRMKVRLLKMGYPMEFFYVMEENKRGGFHVHALVKSWALGHGYHALRTVGDSIAGGMNRTEVIKSEKELWYVVKYMFKGGRKLKEDRYGFV